MFGNETFLTNPVSKVSPTFAVSWYYPNTYVVGMSGLGFQLVWGLMESDPEVQVKRGFTDTEETGGLLSELIGFTFSWELDYENILKLLEQNGIARLSRDRDDDQALVFGGGPVLTANPEPFADFFDVVLLGDAEAIVPSFLEAWKRVRTLPTRKAKLRELSKVPGIYVPALYEVHYQTENGPIERIGTIYDDTPNLVAKQTFTAPEDYAAHTLILSDDTTWSDTFLIEVVRSCPQECRFCLASYLTRPFRATKVDTLMDKIDNALRHTKRVGLLGPSVTEHPEFDRLATELLKRDALEVTVASIRADTVSESVLAMIKKLGQRSVTIAIESGSERLRTIMKKNLSEKEIFDAVRMIEESGLEGVKFYGIAGLPHETQHDLEETVRLMLELKKKHKRLRLVFGVSSFVPKAQTPFQWHGRDRDCKTKLEFLRARLAKVGIEVRPESHNWSDIQALLSRGDRRLTPTLLKAVEFGGKLGSWKKALKETASTQPGLEYYAFREIPKDEVLPWNHICDNSRVDYLRKHEQKAREASLI